MGAKRKLPVNLMRTTPSRVVLVPVIVLGVLAVVLAARDGVKIGPDSSVYLGVADSLSHGKGFTVPFHYYPLGNLDIGTPAPGQTAPAPTPLTQYAPLLPAVLALWPGHATTMALVVNLLALATLLAIVGRVVLAETGSTLRAIGAQLLTACSTSILDISRAVLSEPIFLALTLLALVLLTAHLRRPSWLHVAAIGACCSLALLDRYSGAGLIITAVGILLMRRRLREAAVIAVMSVLPLVGYELLGHTSGASSTNRQIVWHPRLDALTEGIRTAADWILPSSVPGALRVLMAAVVIVGTLALAARVDSLLIRTLMQFAFVYTAFLLLVSLLLDATTAPDTRLLLPVFVAWVVIVCCRLPTHRLSVALLSGAVLLSLGRAAVFVGRDPRPYLRYGGVEATKLKVLLGSAGVSEGELVYTDIPDGFYAVLRRAVSTVPERVTFTTGRPNPKFDAQIDEMRRTLTRTGGAVVYVRQEGRSFVPTAAELERLLPCQPVTESADGMVCRLSN
jgi:hypothetical protein